MQLFSRWNALPKSARVVGASGAGAVLALAIAGALLSHPARLALFAAPLHAEQVTEVEEQLAAWNVAFTPTADNVVVDAARRNDVLLRLSLAGIPHAHLETTGEALSNVGMLTPQEVIDAQTRAGLSGEIEAGLRGIDGIDDARVIVAPAKPAEFADETSRDASASVRLRTRSGAPPSPEAIAGIAAFVAASVAGLKASRVTILDDRGIALGRGGSNDDAAGLQRSLQTALDGAFGSGTTIVRVRAEYRNESVERRELRRAPLGTQAIQRVSRSESFRADGKQYRHDDDSEDRGSETNEVFSRQRSGTLERLSTAVFVDATRALELARVRDLAAATVGYDPHRGDTLAVEAVDFHHAPAARKDVWWLLYGAIVPALPVAILVGGAIVAVRFALPALSGLLKPFIERAVLARASSAVRGVPAARVHSILEHEPPHTAAAVISALPAATAAAVLDLYPAHERDAIVRRMQRPHCTLLDDAEELLRRHV